MGSTLKNQKISYLGTTKSGKYIHVEPMENLNFNRQDHLDAYRAHAVFLMHHQLDELNLDQHRLAMNQHYLLAVNAE